MGARAIDLNVDARDFHFILKAAKQFDRKLYSGLRAKLRKAAEDATEDVRAEVVKEPRTRAAKPQTRGLRESLARGTKVQIAATEGSKKVGVFIRTAPTTPAGRALVSKYDNPAGWRHKVFGEWEANVPTQYGRPYFGSVIEKHADEMERAVKRALDEAADAIGRLGHK
jgi:hypothetical protein